MGNEKGTGAEHPKAACGGLVTLYIAVITIPELLSDVKRGYNSNRAEVACFWHTILLAISVLNEAILTKLYLFNK